MATRRSINKSEYVKSIMKLEAEAIIFRCRIFRDLGSDDCDLPFKKEYLEIYDSTKDLPIEEGLKQISLYIQENGIVRREHSAKKYYSDSYGFHAGKKRWPSFYDNPTRRETIVLHPVGTNSKP